MKRIKLLGILLVSAISLIGCSEDNLQNTNQEQNTTQQNVQQAARPIARYTEAEVTAFKNLLIEYDFINLTNQWVEAVQDSNIELAYNLHIESNSRANSMRTRWHGDFDDMVIYIGEISKMPAGSHDGNPCTKNTDGSVWYGPCTGFGKAMVFVVSIPCNGALDQYAMMDEKQKKEALSFYNDCIQSKVCWVCG